MIGSFIIVQMGFATTAGRRNLVFCRMPATHILHGMDKYGHMDFRIVLALSPEEVCRILNTLGQRVQAGERFRAGDYVSGIYLDCDIRLDEYEETGRQVLRIVIPDRNNRYPEHPACMPPYPLQLLKTDNLYWKGDSGTCS